MIITLNALYNTLFLLDTEVGVHPNGGRKVTPCATFGPLRNSGHFPPVSYSCMSFYGKLAPLPEVIVPTVAFQTFSYTVAYTHVNLATPQQKTPHF